MQVKLPVITSYGEFNGVKFDEAVVDTILYNHTANPKPIPVKIGHIFANGENKDLEIADGVIKSLFKEDGKLYAIAEVPDEVWRLIKENRLFATSPEIVIRQYETGETDYELVGLALLGTSQPAIPENYIVIPFSDEPPFKIVGFKVVEEDTFISHFKKSDWSEEDIFFTTEWDKDKAMKKIVEEKGWETLARCCLAVQYKAGEDTSEYPEAFIRYKFPFAELRDGKLMINSKAVATAKAYLNGARGANVNPELAELVEPLVEYLDGLVQKAKEKQEEMKKEGEEVLFKRIFKQENKPDEVILKIFEDFGLKIRR